MFSADKIREMTAAHVRWLEDPDTGERLVHHGEGFCGADVYDALYYVESDWRQADLSGADLRGCTLSIVRMSRADLTGADLRASVLTSAKLEGACLRGAKLVGANMRGANLYQADLTGADVTDASMAGVVLTEANLTGVVGLPDAPVVKDLHKKVAAAVGDAGEHLFMPTWHLRCGTSHCRAGWAITLAGAAGAEFEREYGPSLAGSLIYQASTGRVPNFYASDSAALEDIKKCAGL